MRRVLLSGSRAWSRMVPDPDRPERFHFESTVLGVALELEPGDAWIGAFVKRSHGGWWHVWICLLPFIPIHLSLRR